MCEVLGLETRVFKISSCMTSDIIASVLSSCHPKSYPPSNMFVHGILHHATGAHKKPAVFFWPSKLRVDGSQPEVQLPSPLSSRKFPVRPLKHDGWKSSLPETKSLPLKIGHIKKKIHLPTIDFSGDIFVSGRLAP